MHLVTARDRRVLLDCGLFQGLKNLRLRNWAARLPDPPTLHAIVLTHAHIDHSGYLPLLVRQGFRGPVYCTAATAELLRPLLTDAAHLQEEEAERANRHGYSKHRPALPLYTAADAQAALALLQARPYGAPFPVADVLRAILRPAGHILGSATVELQCDVGAGSPLRLVDSGDLGRYGRPVLRDPAPVAAADVLLLESTYGDRTHPGGGEEELARVIREGAARGGAIVVPAFAVDRTQELLWMLRRLELSHQIPTLPVYVDSPMAIEVSEIYRRHPDELDPDAVGAALEPAQTRRTRTPEESKRLNDLQGPAIIISASGMATGGRVLHHLALRAPDPRTTIVLVGFQAAGTRGRTLADGARELRIFGREVAVRARVEGIDSLSAHADQGELLRWLGGFTMPPRQTYLIHGEPGGAERLAATIRERLGWAVRAAADGETVTLGV
jgi:metallo-beta-lactamase family protein